MPATLKCQRVKYAVHSKTRSPHLTNCFVVLLLDCVCFMPVFGELQVYLLDMFLSSVWYYCIYCNANVSQSAFRLSVEKHKPEVRGEVSQEVDGDSREKQAYRLKRGKTR